MAAITLTPVDNTTAPVVVNSEVLYHVFTINGVTRVLYSKDGRDVYQVDVQESAASIAAASPNLIEITTVNGAEYLFVASTSGIMFIGTDGTGSKILFKYHEEASPINVFSSDSPSVIAGRINSANTTTIASYEAIAQTTSFQTDVSASTNKALITTLTWAAGLGPINDGFNVWNPLISATSIINTYICDSSTPAFNPALVPTIAGPGQCWLGFSYYNTSSSLSSSFRVVFEIIN